MSGRATPDVLLMTSVLRYLQANPFGVDLAELAARFDQSPPQMRAIIDYLWTAELLDAQGLPIPEHVIDFDAEGLEQDEPWVKLVNDPVGQVPMTFSAGELATVQLGLQALAAVAPDADRARIQELAAALRVPAPSTARGRYADAVATMSDAITTGRQLELQYRSADADHATERTVDPLRVEILDGVPYLNAFCRSADGLRWFRADRILSMALGARIAREYSAADRERPLQVTGRSLPRVTCRANASGLTVLQPYLQPRSRMPSVTGSDTVELSFPIRSYDLLAALVVSAGGGIQVVVPEAAVDHVAAWCTAAIAHHAVD